MIGQLLLRGMLVGVVAGLLAFGFARLFGEPQVDSAIAFEESMHAGEAVAPAASSTADAAMPADHADEVELVSRGTQANLGLFAAIVVYGVAFGGIFALIFGFAYGRVGPADPRTVAAILAGLGFLAVVAVPMLKYPANPPSVGQGETIVYRTQLFLAMLLLSVAATAAAVIVRNRLAAVYGVWNATLIAGGGFIVAIVIVMLVLPGINEVPEAFPATLLWQFRVASLGTQAVLWATIGLLFGALTQRSLARA